MVNLVAEVRTTFVFLNAPISFARKNTLLASFVDFTFVILYFFNSHMQHMYCTRNYP
jgi:hypothetical protein